MISKLEYCLLQSAVAIGGLVPVSAGLAGMVMGAGFVGGGAVDADSHIRYLSGLLFGIGLAFWAAIPSIETRTARFRLLTFFVFIGGLARLYGVLAVGTPSAGMLFGLAMELVVTPLLCAWQGRVAHGMTAGGLRPAQSA